MTFQGFGIAPRNINNLNYTGSQLFFVPCINVPREPTTSDRNFPLFTLWRNNNTAAVLPEALGDMWYLARFDPNGTDPMLARWVKIGSGTSGSVIGLEADDGNIAYPDGAGIIEIEGAVVANAVNAKPLFTEATTPNHMSIEIQVAAAVAPTPADTNDAGIASFNDEHFTVDANGFVSLSGGGQAIDEINVDAFTLPGSNPVIPNPANGQITITGGQVATGIIGANVIRTDSLAANTFTIEIQQTDAVAAKDTTKNGVAHFNSAQFTDDEGFISMAGGATAAILTTQGDDGIAVGPDGTGTLNILGNVVANGTHIKPLFIENSAAFTETWDIQLADDFVAVPVDSTGAGICSFDASMFSVDANGYVQSTTPFGSFFWEEVAVNTAMVPNRGYFVNDGAGIDMTLPTTIAQGQIIKIVRKGAGAVTILQSAGQQIHYNTVSTTVGAGGTLASNNQWDAITLVCSTADTTFVVLDSSGMWTAV